VGPALAEYLEIPHVAWVNSIRDVDSEKITVEQDMADSVETAELKFPCLITVEKDIMQPRLPSYRLKLKTKEKKIMKLTFNDFADRDEKNYGLKGSPTQVERIFPPEENTRQILWEGRPGELTENCFKTLNELKYI
jgi:electron transfer flavoprotein beta subunit